MLRLEQATGSSGAEVSACEITQLGSFHLGKYLWEAVA